MLDLCVGLRREGVDPMVCGLEGGPYQERLRAAGVQVDALMPAGSIAAAPRALPSLVRAAARFGRCVSRRRPDVIHTFLQASLAIGTPVARLRRIPTLHTVVALRSQTQPWYFPLIARYQRWVDAYLSFHPPDLEALGIPAAKRRAVEIAPDLTPFFALERDPNRRLEGLDLDGAFPVALSIGRLHPDKGHEEAIRAWTRVLEAYPDARLLVVGDGEDAPRLQALAAELGVSGAVVFAGRRGDLVDLYARTDVFLRMSLKEGVNVSTIQALAAGLPAIGLRNDAPKEILRDEVSGLLVPVGEPGQLAKAIQRVVEEPGLACRLGTEGRAMVGEYYDLGSIVRFHRELYAAIRQRRTIDTLPDMADLMSGYARRFGGGPGAERAEEPLRD